MQKQISVLDGSESDLQISQRSFSQMVRIRDELWSALGVDMNC